MNKSICSIVLVMVLLVSIPVNSYALSDKQLSQCMSKLPSKATDAEKLVAKKKCNSSAQNRGIIPSGYFPKFKPYDLILLCAISKIAPNDDRYSETKKYVRETVSIKKTCQVLYKDPAWQNKKWNEKDINSLLGYYFENPRYFKIR